MYTLFIPQVNKKEKTNIRGLWRNNKGKLYYDYFILQDYHREVDLNRCLPIVKHNLKQECLFYKQDYIGYITGNIWYSKYSKKNIVLKNRKTIVKSINIKNRQELKQAIKDLLKQYGALTIYKRDDDYLLEVFYN